MYLKSLTLRGFKSFANRTVMKFEPGIACVVGPNGSGKSNISDAVLWVLGERNAKNLRGQSMEDVIFSGSSARKPVSMAEVELLLDNSDGTLPIDFAEVSIGRRMYRSGESEYLINGNVVRRLDVLDILHDSGLGTGTHSIISQGNLDSVLSSKPEDRRALIEEAAGILKHKERKQKSERKLAQMDQHLARVHDITAEVERQLKPLERKAKRALLFKDLDARRGELKLQISVDDLRRLQAQWDALTKDEHELEEKIAAQQQALNTAEGNLDALQQNLQVRGERESRLFEGVSRAHNARERLNATSLLLREKRRQAKSDLERIEKTLEESRVYEKRAKEDLDRVVQQQTEAQSAFTAAQNSLDEKEKAYQDAVEQRNELRRELDTLSAEQRSFVHRIETIEARQKALRDQVSQSKARADVLSTHRKELEDRLDAATSQVKTLQDRLSSVEGDVAKLQDDEAKARTQLNETLNAREQARISLDQTRAEFVQISAERKALEEVEQANTDHNPLLAWMVDENNTFSSCYTPLTRALTAPEDLEKLVEALLGQDVAALLLDTKTDPESLLASLANRPGGGSAVIVLPQSHTNHEVLSGHQRLFDLLRVDTTCADTIEALLGDVYVVDSALDALRAHQQASESARFISKDGCIVDASGKISLVGLAQDGAGQGALSRRRTIDELTGREAALQTAYQDAQVHLEQLEENLRTYQSTTLELSESLAQAKGRHESAVDGLRHSKEALASVQAELDSLIAEQEKNEQLLSESEPDSDELQRQLTEAQSGLANNKVRTQELSDALAPLQKNLLVLSEELSEARLEVARLSERAAYASRMVESRTHEIASSSRRNEEAQQEQRVARYLDQAIAPLLAAFETLQEGLVGVIARLEKRSDDARSDAQNLHQDIAQATKAVRESREVVDATTSKMGDVRIEKGRLEVQVEAAIQVITQDCATSLETALKLAQLENRTEAQQELESLERRIKNLGSINPEAAQEYEDIKERYEYLTAQLTDMRYARKALARIVRVIDERMRDDFLTTFNQVNDNFAEIFSILFPGGKAHLSLADPDELETTGVDVSAQPVGKRVRKMSLLSGGEKSMTALALLFAVYRIRQTPFYILDEVEAALDDTNLRRLVAYLNAIRDTTQFIMITHQRRTMESADVLYGVSMQADGVTKVISQKLEQAIAKGA